ncbi:hypothetical protein QBC40DRAFT_224665 [Triangularia verruculosa]|uniref:Uncharacterized protein n=1 Tax=Triangularia verruculosa TaxID=2587418 RepID=A0AAN6XI21_9PEZI|nr:hypothetical protein QBC40DRAFT_224665 [Triangularia verruculosa]
MRPLDLESINESPDNLKDQLLFYNSNLTAVHWIRKLIDRDGPHCIKTPKHGLSLPLELWVMILDQAEAMALNDPQFTFVKVQSITPRKEGTRVVRCVPQKFTLPYTPVSMMKELDHHDDGKLLAGSLYNPASCRDLESFLRCATPEMAAEINAQEVNQEDIEEEDRFTYYTHKSTTRIPDLVELPDQTIDVIFPPGSESGIPGLFHQLTVADVIAWVDGGDCWVCGGGRFLCPGGRCPGLARYLWYFERVGCGYHVSCPLCMGDIFDEHMNHIKCEHENFPISDLEQDEMEGKIKEQMEMLGYKYSPPG